MNHHLFTDRQKVFFDSLLIRKLPIHIERIFENLDIALDFFQALIKFMDEKVMDYVLQADAGGRLSGKRIKVIKFFERTFRSIQEQVLFLTPARVNEYFTIARARRLERRDISTEALVLPFATIQGDYEQAVNVMSLLVEAMLTKDVLDILPHSSMMIPSLFALWTKQTWFSFAEAVQQGHKGAKLVFEKFLLVFMLLGIWPKFVREDHSDFEVSDPEADIYGLMFEHIFESGADSDGHVTLPAPEPTTIALNRRTSVFFEHMYPREALELLEWFKDNSEEFVRDMAEMWENVEHPSREPGGVDVTHGLRPGGLDTIKVDMPELSYAYPHYVQLIPQQDVRNFTARFWFLHSGLDVRYYKTIQFGLEDFQPESETMHTNLLIKYVALHSYWKIVTGQLFRKVYTKRKREYKPRGPVDRQFLVRPHFRWLVPGWNASDRALSRSLEAFRRLPPEGKTFVKSDMEPGEVSSGIVPLDTSAKPIYVYTVEDLGYQRPLSV